MASRNRWSGFALMLLGGCVIRIGPIDDNGAGGGTTSGNDDRGELARQAEVDKYISEVVYQGGVVTKSVQLPSGEIIDGVDRATLPPLPDILPTLPLDPKTWPLPPGVEFGLADFEQYAEVADLVATTTPFTRPDFSPYVGGETDATSIEDYLERYTVGGEPSSDKKRLYAGVVSPTPNGGVFGYVNQYQPEVAKDSFSLIELTVSCPALPAPAQEFIGIAIYTHRFGKAYKKAQMRIEYGRNVNGKIVAVWDGADGQFHVNPLRRHRPGKEVPVSVLQGKQIEHLLAIVQWPATRDWFVFYDGDALGYYPASLFTLLNNGACNANWYGEVYNELPKDQSTLMTEMGSGLFASAGANGAAYIRSPLYIGLNDWYGPEPLESNTLPMVPQIDACYTRSKLDNGIFYLGGPGGKNPACVWPQP